MTADAINLSQVSYQWPSQQHVTLAIDSLIIKQGERVLLTGQSGSGKTTLLNLLCGILSPSAGSIELLNQPLHSMSASQRDRFRAQHLGVIFQQFNLLPYLPVLDNVTLPCHFSKQRKHKAMPLNKTAAKLLEQLKLAPSLHQRPITELSVGQQQRVAVARALIGQPEIIIADEPTSALDHQRRDDFLALLFEQIEKTNGTLIFVSHDTSLAPHFSRVLELSALNQARGAHDPA